MTKSQEMTLAEIRRILDDTCDPAMITSLEKDPRKGVARLLASWRRRMERDKNRRKRTEALYLPVRAAWSEGYRNVAGIDEAGRGPLAGPVVAACVVLPKEPFLDVDDSKKLSKAARERLYDSIIEHCPGYGIGIVSPAEIDELNIYRAAQKAMTLALEACAPAFPDFCFVDAMQLPEAGIPQRSLVHGDSICAAISAASIVAKVHRDRIMVKEAERFPVYGFDKHKGYGSADHMKALARYGPSPIHRLSFSPVLDYALPSLPFFSMLIRRCTSTEALREVGMRIRAARADLTDSELDELRALYKEQSNRLKSGGPVAAMASPPMKVRTARPSRHEIGRDGEDLAVAYLERAGFTLLRRNYRCRSGEIDIIAGKDGLVIFVEVKTDFSGSAGEVTEWVTPAKRQRIVRAARRFLAVSGPSFQTRQVRFDVVVLYRSPSTGSRNDGPDPPGPPCKYHPGQSGTAAACPIAPGWLLEHLEDAFRPDDDASW